MGIDVRGVKDVREDDQTLQRIVKEDVNQ